MSNVVNLGDQRLAKLREREDTFALALTVLADVRAATDDTIGRYHWALRVALDNRADGKPLGEPDHELEAAGEEARSAVATATEACDNAQKLLAGEIAQLCTTNKFAEGDKVHSPRLNQDLIVASIYVPATDVTLTEVTLTADGASIEKVQHSYALDGSGRPIDDGLLPIRWERWWGGGYRAGGYAHPVTRRITT